MKSLSQDHPVGLAANDFISEKVNPECFTVFSQSTNQGEGRKDTHHTCTRYNTNDISWLHHLGRIGPFHISPPTSGTDLPTEWKGMLSLCYQSRMFPQQAMTWGVQLPPPPKGSQLCPQHRAVQTSQVSFSYVEEDAKGSWESAAQLTLAQGSKGAVLRFCHTCIRQQGLLSICIFWVWQMKPEWERHLRVLLLFLFWFTLKRESSFIC